MNKLKISASVILFIIILVSASVNAEDNLMPLNDRTPRKSTFGFSFVPPPGENWFEKFGEHTIRYFKKTDDETYSFFANATECNFKTTFKSQVEFLKFVKSQREIPAELSDRFKNSRGEYKISNRFSTFCISYQERYEDHGAKNVNRSKFLTIENTGLICLHPDNRKVGVNIYFSERYEGENNNKVFRKEGEEFINSLKLFSVKQ